ncbi:MAG: anti-sigma factor family protein, partial [Bacteroidia bacterium]
MAKLPPYSKLPDEPCLTEAQLFAYLDEQLSPAEQHEAEHHLLDCAMCSDALEGLSMLQNRKAIHAAVPLATATPINETVQEEDNSKKIIPLFRRPVVLASAAVVALLLGVTVLMKMGIGEAEKSQLADVVQEEKKQEAPALRADSIAANTMQEPAQLDKANTKNAPLEQQSRIVT